MLRWRFAGHAPLQESRRAGAGSWLPWCLYREEFWDSAAAAGTVQPQALPPEAVEGKGFRDPPAPL